MDLLVCLPTACSNQPLRAALPKETPDSNPLQIGMSSNMYDFLVMSRQAYDFSGHGVRTLYLSDLGYDLLAL